MDRVFCVILTQTENYEVLCATTQESTVRREVSNCIRKKYDFAISLHVNEKRVSYWNEESDVSLEEFLRR